MDHKVAGPAARHLAAQSVAIHQHQAINTLRTPKRVAQRRASAEREPDECRSLELECIQDVSYQRHHVSNAPVGRQWSLSPKPGHSGAYTR
jgi:hypothetical protein